MLRPNQGGVYDVPESGGTSDNVLPYRTEQLNGSALVSLVSSEEGTHSGESYYELFRPPWRRALGSKEVEESSVLFGLSEEVGRALGLESVNRAAAGSSIAHSGRQDAGSEEEIKKLEEDAAFLFSPVNKVPDLVWSQYLNSTE